jgi:methionyl-tRNA synthetase
MVLMHKLCSGKVPVLHTTVLNETDHSILAEFVNTKQKVEASIEQYKFRDALSEVIDLSRKGNRYMQEKQPWIVAKTIATEPANQQLIDNCIHICLQLTANLAILINPFLPFTAKKILHMLKVVEKMLDWENAGKQKLLSVGYSLREPQLLFRKIEDHEINEQLEKLKTAQSKTEAIKKEKEKMETKEESGNQPSADSPQPLVNKNFIPDTKGVYISKSEIQYDDFAKLDLKVATIVQAEKVQKADKLLKLEVDLGYEKRTIVSGIAEHFKPEDIIGKQVVVVVNLAPRKMRGIESNGMILMAEDADHKLYFINPEHKISPGAGVS